MKQLAVNGGEPIRKKQFTQSITTSSEETKEVIKVMEKGLLSGFAASPTGDFYGGHYVRLLEESWSDHFKINHSIACNSATSALIMALGALEVGPGDEVIVPSVTMSATATSVLVYNAVPIFSDIENDMFCLDPAGLEMLITDRTKVIVAVDLNGQSSDIDAINKIAKKYNIKVLIDCAQSPGAMYKGRFAGTGGDIGVYSLNRHKNIQCGEGGLAVTNDSELALRMQLIRNHGESLVGLGFEEFQPNSLINMIGFNFRMTELEAAVASVQVKKLDSLNQYRIEMSDYLASKLSGFDGLTMPKVRDKCTHVHFIDVIKYNEKEVGIKRDLFIEMLSAEGIPFWGDYKRPLYLEPIYQQKIAYKGGYPFKNNIAYDREISYEKGICPVAESLEGATIVNAFLYSPLNKNDMDDIANAFYKIYDNRKNIRS